MLLGAFSASLLGNMFVGKEVNRAGDEIIKAGVGSKRSLTKSFNPSLSFN